jgi:hypothetical protein
MKPLNLAIGREGAFRVRPAVLVAFFFWAAFGVSLRVFGYDKR